jgi:hypothetical protein
MVVLACYVPVVVCGQIRFGACAIPGGEATPLRLCGRARVGRPHQSIKS